MMSADNQSRQEGGDQGERPDLSGNSQSAPEEDTFVLPVVMVDHCVDWHTLDAGSPLTLYVFAGLLKTSNPANKTLIWSRFMESYCAVLGESLPHEWYYLFQEEADPGMFQNLVENMIEKYYFEYKDEMVAKYLMENQNNVPCSSSADVKEEICERIVNAIGNAIQEQLRKPSSRCILGYVAVKLFESKVPGFIGPEEVARDLGSLFWMLKEDFELRFQELVQLFPSQLEIPLQFRISYRYAGGVKRKPVSLEHQVLQERQIVRRPCPPHPSASCVCGGDLSRQIQDTQIDLMRIRITELESEVAEKNKQVLELKAELARVAQECDHVVQMHGDFNNKVTKYLSGQNNPGHALKVLAELVMLHSMDRITPAEVSVVLSCLRPHICTALEAEFFSGQAILAAPPTFEELVVDNLTTNERNATSGLDGHDMPNLNAANANAGKTSASASGIGYYSDSLMNTSTLKEAVWHACQKEFTFSKSQEPIDEDPRDEAKENEPKTNYV